MPVWIPNARKVTVRREWVLVRWEGEEKIKKISIVSHSKYIREEVMVKSLITRKEEKFLRKDKKLYNNQILEKDYEYDKKKIYVRSQKFMILVVFMKIEW